MDLLIVRGGERLQGTVEVSGAKNAALPIMAAALAVPGCTRLRRIPQLRDITSMSELLSQLGMQVRREANGELTLSHADARPVRADYDLVRKMRASVCVLGPLLASRGAACVSLPGGCNIGHRPIDLHLKGLAALGADISIRQGYVVATAAERLRGARIDLTGPQGSTVTGTCNVLVAATLARGATIIDGAAREPEVVDLGQFLNTCGARIEGLGTSRLVIEGVSELSPSDYEIIPDRIEAATWLIAAAITRGTVQLDRCDSGLLSDVIEHLQRVGVPVETKTAGIFVNARNCLLRGQDVIARPFPGFPTDVQAQMTALLCRAEGTSVVTDHVFPDRFMHAAELLRMGASLRQAGNSVVIQGVSRLCGAPVMASDLRASAALVLAALAAEGETTIHRIYHLDRGYEQLAEKLKRLGADVTRCPESAHSPSPLGPPHWPAAVETTEPTRRDRHR